ncbi:MAG: tetratricopeptide repeat protein [Verrucomicrobiota bacterium]
MNRSKPVPARAAPPVEARSRLTVWLLAVLLLLVTIALYWPATGHDFLNFDDPDYVTANPHVQQGLHWEGVKWAFCNPVCGNWHPLTVLSHALDCQVFSAKPWGHHLTSVLLHALNAALVFALFQQMTGATWQSLFVAALFAVHPLRIESVAWVAERKDVLSGFFGLLALIFYARYAGETSETRSPKPEGNLTPEIRKAAPTHHTSHLTHHVSRFTPYTLSLLFLALGLMSKPMLVTWPFVMLLLDYWPLKRMRNGWRLSLRLLWEKIPFFALAAAASVVTFVVQKREGALMAAESLPFGARVGNALISYCRYLGKLCWPADLAIYYPYPGQWPSAQVLLAGGLLLVLSLLFLGPRRRFPFLLVGWLWFVGMLVPVIGLVQAGSQAMADRYTYLPSLGVLILAAWGTCELTRRWRYGGIVLSVAGSAAIVLCLVLTRQQLGHWKDSETLFRHAIEVTQGNAIAHNSLGSALVEKGRVDEAIREYREALRLRSDYADAQINLGTALSQRGQTDEAIRHYREAVRLQPDHAGARIDLGTALDEQGQTEEAIRQYREAIRLQPDHAAAHYNLGNALAKNGQMDEAISQLQQAISLRPTHVDAHNNLGVALYQQGRMDEAIRQFQEVLRLKPDYAGARRNLDAALATPPGPSK